MSKHTPGPWEWRYWNDVGPDDAYFEEGYTLDGPDGEDVTENEASRRLIAAAPQMYELLRAYARAEDTTETDAATRALIISIDGG